VESNLIATLARELKQQQQQQQNVSNHVCV